MSVSLIVALDKDGAIGNSDGSIPWKSKTDQTRFKELTTGGTVIMGRKTFDSLGRVLGLPNRKNVVLTSSDLAQSQNVIAVKSLVWLQAHQTCLGCEPPHLWVIGGASVYDRVIDDKLIDMLYVTKVNVNSGAPVKLKHNLYEHEQFMHSQFAKGVQWRVIDQEEPEILDGEPSISYITMRRVRS